MATEKYIEGLVSCIITTHNRLHLLKRAVESVKKQSYPNIELIVVDDASTDGTQEWSEEQELIYIRIPKEESKGGNYARNLGIKCSKGQFIAFLDDDDYWFPDKTQKQIDVFKKSGAGVIYGNRVSEIVGKDGNISYYEDKIDEKVRGDLSKFILTRIVSSTSFIMVERSVLDEVGYFDENLRFWQEYELMIRLAQTTKFDFTPDSVTYYRIDNHDANRLTSKFTGWKEAVRYIHKKHSELYKKLSFNEKFNAKALVWGDATNRAKLNGLKKEWVKYKMLYSMWRVFDILRNGRR